MAAVHADALRRAGGDLRPVYSDTTQLDVELSCVAINGPLTSLT